MSRLKTLLVLNFGIYESLRCEKPILFSIPQSGSVGNDWDCLTNGQIRWPIVSGLLVVDY